MNKAATTQLKQGEQCACCNGAIHCSHDWRPLEDKEKGPNFPVGAHGFLCTKCGGLRVDAINSCLGCEAEMKAI